MALKSIFSGIQPTGKLHLGNYLGAVRNWVRLQDEARGIVLDNPETKLIQENGFERLVFSVVDLHAMTMPYKANELHISTKDLVSSLLACGLKPNAGSVTSGEPEILLYNQGSVRAHTELAWLLSCITPLGWLQRMTQFKSKSGNEKNSAVLGLLSYPVLQAADILLYRATHVPVGEDQIQHIELARNIATSFNHAFCTTELVSNEGETDSPFRGGKKQGLGLSELLRQHQIPNSMVPFPEPKEILLPEGARIMSLRDGTKKMSKSDPNVASRINLDDTPDEIREKIRAAKTDGAPGFLPFDPIQRPEKANLCTIFGALTGRTPEDVAEEFASSSAVAFKDALTEVLIDHLTPIQARLREVEADPDYVDSVLKQGSDAANEIAEKTISDVRRAMGYC